MSKRAKVFGILGSSLAGALLSTLNLAAQSSSVRQITLTEAQTRAVAGKVADLARLSVDAAKYHRQATQADYFPKIDATFWNLHFNKFMGETIQLARGATSLPLLQKDQTAVIVNLTQPVTPLFKVHQAVEIARADETIARAKGSQLATQTASNVERSYFALLVAQRQLAVAEIKTKMAASQATLLNVSKDLLTARSEVTELTKSLNALLGFAPDTVLDLAAPEPVTETISETQATQQAIANSPEIVEAEQTVVKARAATRLSKLEYIPDVAVIGGYTFQTVIPVLPNDFSYLGVMASYTLFDFGKREKTVSERRTELDIARLNVDMVKAKVASAAQKSVFELQRKKQIRDLTRRLASVYQTMAVNFQDSKMESQLERAQAEADMFQAELDYRIAFAELKRTVEGR
jgi:outer membrane protein TolC